MADEMEKLQKSVEDEELKATIADLRKPAPASPNGATSQNGERGCLISESDRLVFFEKVERLVTPAA